MPSARKLNSLPSEEPQRSTDTGPWRHLFAEARDPQILCGRDGRLLEINEAAARAFGLTRRSRLLEDGLFDPGTTMRIGEILRRDLSGPETLTAVRVNVPDGSRLEADLRMTRLNSGAWLIGFRLSTAGESGSDSSSAPAKAVDVPDAVFARRSLAHGILNSLEGSLYLVDGRLRLLDFSDGWLKLPPEHGWLRFHEAPRIGRPLLDYACDPARRAELEKAFGVALAEGQAQELRSVDALGRDWLMNVLPWRQEGRIRGVIYRVTDNTAFAGVQNQLFQAQKLGTIGALAAGVAHDFNNLLLAIRGNVGLLAMDPNTSAEAKARLEQIDNAAGRASDLSQQLLSFSRPAEEQIVILDLNDIVHEVATLTRRLLRGRISLEVRPSADPAKVQMDATRASQVLLNLCINAHDAMPKGGTLTIANGLIELTEAQAAKVRRKPGEKFVRCSVSDTGSGIPPELLTRIFNPFFTTKEKGKGTGLGLSIVHDVVSKAGGFIEVESIVGSGTTFHICLPVERRAVTKPDTELRHKLRHGTGRLLVVDDLDLVLDFATNFLRQAGYEVLRASNADAALKLLSEQSTPVDLIFTDYAMPGKTGWQLIQEATSRWPRIRCLLASGYLDDSERAQISQNPTVRILNKPYGIAEATHVIAEMLHPSDVPAVSAPPTPLSD